MKALSCLDHWIEEPTSPDDFLGHARIAREVSLLVSRPANTVKIG